MCVFVPKGLELERLDGLQRMKDAQNELLRQMHDKFVYVMFIRLLFDHNVDDDADDDDCLIVFFEREKEEFLKRRKEEEERLKLEDELERQQREEEITRAIEEAKRIALEEFIRLAEIERSKEFAKSLIRESNYFDYSQEITRAFVFSYFDLLRYLSLQSPGKGKGPKVKPSSKTPTN